ncbi:MAG: NAD(P)-dependent alcohol dehydrogenase [Prolixibacteraceae bacterium]|jgi:NADPH:quinone reductase-like Zn-dependent oxidoreductase|nr:NAD(P)-dependent alcohol dehydrogenase [Prolixibacteraceae bacterium]
METQNMKAVLCTKYGEPEVLKMSEVTKPFPKHNEVCIKIHATAVTMSDIFIRSSDLPLRYKIPMRLVLGIRKPRRAILGLVLAGVVESTGKNCSDFKVGDKVYGITGFGMGCYAEYKCMKENDSTYGCLALMPKNVSFEEAGSLAYGGLLALQYIEHGNIKKGDHVAIYGASSNSGTLAIQLANNFGAHVTAICSSKNHKLVKELGADVVMDYQVQDEIPAGVQFDFVLDAVGNIKTSKLKEACKKALVSDGKYTSIDDGDLKLVAHRLDKIREFTEAGVLKAILDRTYPLDEIVEAHRYVQNGHKKGGVAISVL